MKMHRYVANPTSALVRRTNQAELQSAGILTDQHPGHMSVIAAVDDATVVRAAFVEHLEARRRRQDHCS